MWYYLFVVLCIAIAVWGSPHDRGAMRIVAFATIVGLVFTTYIIDQIDGAWSMGLPSAVEFATIGMLYRMAWSRTGQSQALAIAAAWVMHAIMFLAAEVGAWWVYDSYVLALQCIAAVQIAICHETWSRWIATIGNHIAMVASAVERDGALTCSARGLHRLLAGLRLLVAAKTD